MQALWSNLWKSLGYANSLDKYTHVESGIHHPYMNGIMQLKAEAFNEEELARISSHFQQKNLPYIWVLNELDCTRYEPKLIQLGHRLFSQLDGMELQLTSLQSPITNHTVLSVETTRDFTSWLKVMQRVFEIPDALTPELISLYLPTLQSKNFLHAIIYEGAEPIASGTAHLTSEACELFYIATKKERRNRGFASAIVSHLLHESYKRGLRTSRLAATPNGKSVYERFGFKQVCSFKLYTCDETSLIAKITND